MTVHPNVTRIDLTDKEVEMLSDCANLLGEIQRVVIPLKDSGARFLYDSPTYYSNEIEDILTEISRNADF